MQSNVNNESKKAIKVISDMSGTIRGLLLNLKEYYKNLISHAKNSIQKENLTNQMNKKMEKILRRNPFKEIILFDNINPENSNILDYSLKEINTSEIENKKIDLNDKIKLLFYQIQKIANSKNKERVIFELHVNNLEEAQVISDFYQYQSHLIPSNFTLHVICKSSSTISSTIQGTGVIIKEFESIYRNKSLESLLESENSNTHENVIHVEQDENKKESKKIKYINKLKKQKKEFEKINLLENKIREITNYNNKVQAINKEIKIRNSKIKKLKAKIENNNTATEYKNELAKLYSEVIENNAPILNLKKINEKVTQEKELEEINIKEFLENTNVTNKKYKLNDVILQENKKIVNSNIRIEEDYNKVQKENNEAVDKYNKQLEEQLLPGYFLFNYNAEVQDYNKDIALYGNKKLLQLKNQFFLIKLKMDYDGSIPSRVDIDNFDIFKNNMEITQKNKELISKDSSGYQQVFEYNKKIYEYNKKINTDIFNEKIFDLFDKSVRQRNRKKMPKLIQLNNAKFITYPFGESSNKEIIEKNKKIMEQQKNDLNKNEDTIKLIEEITLYNDMILKENQQIQVYNEDILIFNEKINEYDPKFPKINKKFTLKKFVTLIDLTINPSKLKKLLKNIKQINNDINANNIFLQNEIDKFGLNLENLVNEKESNIKYKKGLLSLENLVKEDENNLKDKNNSNKNENNNEISNAELFETEPIVLPNEESIQTVTIESYSTDSSGSLHSSPSASRSVSPSSTSPLSSSPRQGFFGVFESDKSNQLEGAGESPKTSPTKKIRPIPKKAESKNKANLDILKEFTIELNYESQTHLKLNITNRNNIIEPNNINDLAKLYYEDIIKIYGLIHSSASLSSKNVPLTIDINCNSKLLYLINQLPLNLIPSNVTLNFELNDQNRSKKGTGRVNLYHEKTVSNILSKYKKLIKFDNFYELCQLNLIKMHDFADNLQSKPIRLISADFEGCLFNENYEKAISIKESNSDLIIDTNKKLLESIDEENHYYKEVIWFDGLTSDIDSGQNSVSHHQDLQKLSKHFKPKNNNQIISLNKFLMPDLLNNKEIGTTFNNKMDNLDSLSISVDMDAILLRYAQIHQMALKYPAGQKFTFDVYSGSKDVLIWLNFFANHPDLLPKGVELRTHFYNGQKNEVFNIIRGTGKANKDYQQMVKNVFKECNGKEFEPEKNKKDFHPDHAVGLKEELTNNQLQAFVDTYHENNEEANKKIKKLSSSQEKYSNRLKEKIIHDVYPQKIQSPSMVLQDPKFLENLKDKKTYSEWLLTKDSIAKKINSETKLKLLCDKYVELVEMNNIIEKDMPATNRLHQFTKRYEKVKHIIYKNKDKDANEFIASVTVNTALDENESRVNKLKRECQKYVDHLDEKINKTFKSLNINFQNFEISNEKYTFSDSKDKNKCFIELAEHINKICEHRQNEKEKNNLMIAAIIKSIGKDADKNFVQKNDDLLVLMKKRLAMVNLTNCLIKENKKSENKIVEKEKDEKGKEEKGKEEKNEKVKPPTYADCINNFKKELEVARPTISQRRDSGAITFLKVIATVLTFWTGFAPYLLWKKEGAKTANNLENITHSKNVRNDN